MSPRSSSNNKSEFQQPRMHPSRPPRPALLESPTQNDPSFARHNSMSQPRLNQAFQHDRPPRPQPQSVIKHSPTPPIQQQQPPLQQQQQPQQEKKPLTYGEYRKLKQQQMQQQQQQFQQQQHQMQQPQQQQPPVMSRRDPRRPPKPVEASTTQKPPLDGSKLPSDTSSLGKFKIPKKKKPEIEHKPELFKPDQPVSTSKKDKHKDKRRDKDKEKEKEKNKDKDKDKDSSSENQKSSDKVIDEVEKNNAEIEDIKPTDPGSDSEPELKIAESDDEQPQQQQPSNRDELSLYLEKKLLFLIVEDIDFFFKLKMKTFRNTFSI